MKGNFSFPVSVSKEVKDLIRRMLRLKPNERISIPDMLSHPWVTNDEDEFDMNSTFSEREQSHMLQQ